VQKKTSKIYILLLVEPYTPQRGKTGRSKKEKILLKKERQMRVTKRKRKRKKEPVVCIRALGPFSIQLCPKINPQRAPLGLRSGTGHDGPHDALPMRNPLVGRICIVRIDASSSLFWKYQTKKKTNHQHVLLDKQ